MSASSGWTREQEKECARLARRGNILNKDIATKIGKKPASVGWKLRQLGIENTARRKVIGKWNSKHAHLRLPVMKYFLNHTAEQCQAKFKLTRSEFKSLMTVSYRMKEFSHIRKETRTHRPYSAQDYRFLLAHAGLMPREWIAKKLKRGGALGIKDRLEKLGVSSKSLNGLTLSQFRDAFGKEPDFLLQTKAGPGRREAPTHYKIIPWVWLDNEINARRLRTARPMRQVIRSMSLFQQWIHGENTIAKLKRICA